MSKVLTTRKPNLASGSRNTAHPNRHLERNGSSACSRIASARAKTAFTPVASLVSHDHVKHGLFYIMFSARASKSPSRTGLLREAHVLPRNSPDGSAIHPYQLFQFFVHFGKRVHGELQILARMRGGDLCANTRGAMRHDRIKEADDVNTFLQHARGELL